MFRNYLRAAYRNFLKDKLSGFISLAGYAVGMACCILIWIYVTDELSYNRQNRDLNRIYRVNWITTQDGQANTDAVTPIPLAPAFRNKIAGVQTISRMYLRAGEMQTGDPNAPSSHVYGTRFQEQYVFFADQSVFQTFSTTFIHGNAASSGLDLPGNLVITDEMAHKYFGDGDPTGKTLWYENKLLLRVTGVVKKPPVNSDIRFDFLVSFESLYPVENKNIADFLRSDWTYNSCYTYVVLDPGQQAGPINLRLNDLLKLEGNPRNRQLNTIVLQPFRDIHLYASDINGNPSNGSITDIYIFLAIALLILFIANVNFINLSVARAVTRIREIGMRRVLGAGKKHLILQILAENGIISAGAFLVAIILSWMALPVLNQLTGKQLGSLAILRGGKYLYFYPVFFCRRHPCGSLSCFFYHPHAAGFGLERKIEYGQ
jgi:putative ABC transport system permease protein